MKHEATSQSNLMGNDRQNSHVSGQQEPSQPANQAQMTTQQTESAHKNLELLKSILQDFSRAELEAEIFTLHEVTGADPSNKKGSSQIKQSRSKVSKQESAASSGPSLSRH